MIEVYDCFQRTWWKDNSDWPNGLEPHAGRKNFFFRNEIGSETHAFFTEEEAVDFADNGTTRMMQVDIAVRQSTKSGQRLMIQYHFRGD